MSHDLKGCSVVRNTEFCNVTFTLAFARFIYYNKTLVTEIKDLKTQHKKLKTITKKATKKRLNDRASDSWKDLRELKKLKLRVKDKINQLKH